MVKIDKIPIAVLTKIKEFAFIQYNVESIVELKAAIVEERFEQIVNEYLNEAKLRIMKFKADEAKAYNPTDKEIIAKIQARIDAASLQEPPEKPPEEP